MRVTRGAIALFFLFNTAWLEAAALSPPARFHSPSGRYDILLEPLTDDWTHVHKAQPGVAREATEQYALAVCVTGSTEALTVVYFSDSGTRPAPEAVVESILWSPGDAFLVFPDRPHALLDGHVLQRVAAVEGRKVWNLEADHVHWVDDHRFIGDLNTPKIPGGILVFDGKAGTSELLISPDRGIGYQIARVSGTNALITQILNTLDVGKVTWDQFAPACFALDLNTFKKRSVSCLSPSK
jgi:hypothetical protein